MIVSTISPSNDEIYICILFLLFFFFLNLRTIHVENEFTRKEQVGIFWKDFVEFVELLG